MATKSDTIFLLDVMNNGHLSMDAHRSYKGAAENACNILKNEYGHGLTEEIATLISSGKYGATINAWNGLHKDNVYNDGTPKIYIKITEVIVRP